MFRTIRLLFTKYRETILYLVFGGLTTLVNFLIYFPLYNLLALSAAASNVVAWAVAVAFAFVTNKIFVFQSNNWDSKNLVSQIIRFVACRVGSGLLETVFLLLAVDAFSWNGNLWKIIISVVVVILNYIGSKFLVFTQKS